MGGYRTWQAALEYPEEFAAIVPICGGGSPIDMPFVERLRNLPIWAFHGDKDGVCPISKDQQVFAAIKKLGGNMKFTTWAGDNHAVSGKFIPGAKNGTTQLSSNHCDKETDFLTWLFKQRRK